MSPDSEIKPVYHNRKICYKRRRSQRDYPFKKRKFYYRSSASSSGGGISSEDICSSPRKGFSCDASVSGATMDGGLFPSFPFFFMVFIFFSCDGNLVLSLPFHLII